MLRPRLDCVVPSSTISKMVPVTLFGQSAAFLVKNDRPSWGKCDRVTEESHYDTSGQEALTSDEQQHWQTENNKKPVTAAWSDVIGTSCSCLCGVITSEHLNLPPSSQVHPGQPLLPCVCGRVFWKGVKCLVRLRHMKSLDLRYLHHECTRLSAGTAVLYNGYLVR